MKTGWILIGLAGIVSAMVLGSLIACPYDLHGATACGSTSRAGRDLGFYLVYPGLWLGSIISNGISNDDHTGESFAGYLIGVSIWLAALVGSSAYLFRRLRRGRAD